MRKNLLRTVIVLLVALTATFASVSDDFREYDAAYVRIETLKEASDSLADHRGRSAVYYLLVGTSSKSRYLDQSAATPSPTRASLCTCVLLC